VKPFLLALAGVVLSTAACSGRADVPDTPDLSALLQSYERPTASLDVSTVTSALDSAPPLAQLQQLAAGVQAAKLVLNNVNYASTTSSTKTGSRLRVQGSLALKIRCPGERTQPNYDESVNGSISLTLAIADNSILRSIGGQANACVLSGTARGLSVRVELDGPVAFDLGGNIGLGQPWSGELLASLPGTLTVDTYEFQSVSARFTHDRFQYLLHLPDKDGTDQTVVLELSDSGITVREASGVWFCAEGESCAKQ